LISTGGAGRAALELALASEFGIAHTIDRMLLSGRTDRAIIRDLFRLHGLADSIEDRRRLAAGYLRHLPGCLKRAAGKVLPGVAELLQRLSGRSDIGLGLLTGNTRQGAQIKLGFFGLDGYFALGGYGDDHHERDDVARSALAEVYRRHGETVRPEQVWVIGDTPLDILCARCIGARSVAVATGWHDSKELAQYRPDVLVEDLGDPGPLWRHLGEHEQ
jgi:phosphoglycolate phosphatase-like HAD superfamily hydrolase